MPVTGEHVKGHFNDEHQKVLARLLLASNPAAAWQLSGAGHSPGFAVKAPRRSAESRVASVAMQQEFLDEITTRANIFTKTMQTDTDKSVFARGKQAFANAQAGLYDIDAVQSDLNEKIASAPAVMFTWAT